MLSHLSPAQRELAEFMSALSERAYGASWMEGLEFAIWRAVSDGRFKYGQLELTPEHIHHLVELSRGCGGWIFFEKDHEESFAPFSEWKRLVSLAGGVE
jgi:hypothetical protein